LKAYIFHETAICRNQHNSSNSNSRITGELNYKYACCQNGVSTKKEAFPNAWFQASAEK